jgi:hypothetical protein
MYLDTECSRLAHLYDISMEQKRQLQTVGMFLDKPDPRSFCGRTGGGRDWPDGRGVFSTPDSSLSIWVNGEDHIRLFARLSPVSTNLVDVLEELIESDFLIEKTLREIGGWSFSHDPHFGYLTTCPTRLGVLDIRLELELELGLGFNLTLNLTQTPTLSLTLTLTLTISE